MIGPRKGLSYGGKEIFITGSCFDNDTVLLCRFAGILVPGEILDSQRARCISPFMKDANGSVILELSLDDGQNFNFNTLFYIGR